jgi:formamidopyrimidine-DNA glycosylase
MPELPEVEVVVQGLQDSIIGKKFTSIKIKKKKLTNFSESDFFKTLKDQKITSVERIGKMIVIHLDANILVFHLKMTGQLIYEDLFLGGHTLDATQDGLINKHTHLIFTFADKTRMFFNDQRLFGYCHLIQPNELTIYANKYGIDPIKTDFTYDDFIQIVAKHPKTNLKAFLLNQKYIAGIGNIYADEIAFKTKISPKTPLQKIPTKKLKELHKNIKDVLVASIQAKGTTFSHFLLSDSSRGNFKQFLKVYGRADQPCNNCNKPLTKIRWAGRGTVYCEHCQSDHS